MPGQVDPSINVPVSGPSRKPNPEMTAQRFAKLPRWARDHIVAIERERSVAVSRLNEFTDNQTESACYATVYACTGEEQGPTNRKVYFNAKESITIEHAGVHLDVSFYKEDGINLRYRGKNHSDIALMPVCHGSITLSTPDKLR